MNKIIIEANKYDIFLEPGKSKNHNNIFHYIHSSLNPNNTFNIIIKTYNGNINLHYYGKIYMKLLAFTIYIINLFTNMFPHNYDDLTIYIYPHKIKRLLDDKPENLQRDNKYFVPSGMTFLDEKIILLTRKEELIKLLIHELIHYAELDDYLKIYKNCKLNEAYTEFLSIIIFYSIISLLKNKDYNELIKQETLYSQKLAKRILNYFNLSPEIFFKSNYEIINNNLYTYEYIFLRGIYLMNYNLLIDKLLQKKFKSDNEILILLLKLNTKDYEDSIDKIIDNDKSAKYIFIYENNYL